MDSTTKALLALVGAVIIGGFIWGAYQYPKVPAVGTSTAGTTLSTAKFAGITGVSLASPGTVGATGANGTSTSILNSDAFDRYVTGTRVVCNGVGTSQAAYTGVGLSALTVSVGTTSSAAPATLLSYAPVVNAITLATSSVVSGFATSTQNGFGGGGSATSSRAFVWTAGSYMTFAFNATNTATCTVGVDYISS